MAQALIPKRSVGCKEGDSRWCCRIKVVRAVTSKEHLFGREILHKKTICIKFNGGIIMSSKFTNRNQVFDDIGCDKDMI